MFSISVEIVLISNQFCICCKKTSLFTRRVVFSTLKVEDVTIHVQGVTSDRDPVLYLVQYLLDIKANFIPLANCRSHKQNGNNQQAYFKCFRVTQNQVRMLVNIIIIIALARNNSCMNSDRWGILVYRGFHITFDEWVPKFVRNFRSSLLTWQFHYVVVNQLMTFETKLWISRRISLGSCEVHRRQRSSRPSMQLVW